ncbi:MAG TPA: hypothetical protein VLS89_17445 [Candidatus Nanopelagicales bacterium]|nr:hypothetical protein [Candidatus Nanopelagicales bacterium]
MRFLGLEVGAIALLLVATATGCGSGYGALCEDAMDCADGNDADIEACIIDLERREEIAAIYGCEDQWDDYYLCVEEEADCRGDLFGPGLDCADEELDLNQCLD